MRVIHYVPHGAIPDRRGFAPAVVAQNLAKNLRLSKPYLVSAMEDYVNTYDSTIYGDTYRIKEGAIYNRIFKKITRLDPYPLHARAATICDRLGANIFHAHQTEFEVSGFLKKSSKKPFVALHVHAMRNFEPKRGIADIYFAVSEYTKKRMLEERHYPAEKVEVLYNGFDEELFYMPSLEEKNSLKAILGIPANSIVVGYVGRKQQVKGFYNFLRCVKHLRQSGHEIFALCVGPTPWDVVRDENYEEEQKLLKELRAKEWFFDMEPLSHDRLSSVYKAIDVLLFATYFGGEQHPVVAVESLASGCITVSSNMFSLPETIEHGKTGFLLENPRDIDEITVVVEKIVIDFDGFRQIAIDASVDARLRFGWKKIAKKLEKIYFDRLH